jgi:hypothetical protein
VDAGAPQQQSDRASQSHHHHHPTSSHPKYIKLINNKKKRRMEGVVWGVGRIAINSSSYRLFKYVHFFVTF